MARMKYYNENTGEWLYCDIGEGGDTPTPVVESPVEVLEFTFSGSASATSVKTAAEIYALAQSGKFLVARVEVMEDMMWQQLQIGNIQYISGVYQIVVIASTENGQAPVCLAASTEAADGHFTITFGG